MKRILRFMVLAMLICLVACIAVGAADSVAFLSGSGNGDGKSASTPTSDIAQAYALLGDDGGTIVFVGDYSIPATTNFPAHTGKVKLTSVYDGVDYRKTNDAALHYTGTGFATFNGHTEIDGFQVKLDGSSAGFCANFHELIVGYDFATVNTDGSSARRMYVVGGQNADASLGTLDKGETNNIELYSGSYYMIVGFSRNTALKHEGTVTITIGGTADVYDIYFGAVGSGSRGGDSIVRFKDNAFVECACIGGARNTGMAGSSTLYVEDYAAIDGFYTSTVSHFPNGSRNLYYEATVTLPSDYKSHFDNIELIEEVSGDFDVVYVADGGNGDGSSNENPVGTLAGAYALLGEDGGEIVLAGDTTVANALVLEEKDGTVTFSSENGAKLILSGSIALGQNTNGKEVVFDLPIEADGGIVYGGFRNVTFSEGFTVTGEFDFYGGTLSSSAENADNYTVITELPYVITVKNGTFRNFSGGIHRAAYTDLLGSVAADIAINISGGRFTDSFNISGGAFLTEDVTLTVSGGSFECPVFVRSVDLSTQAKATRLSTVVSSDRKYYAMDGDVTVSISGGDFSGGLISAYNTNVAYTQLLRGNFIVDITGGTFTEGTVLDATQVKSYSGEDKVAAVTYPDTYEFECVRFDKINGEAQSYSEPLRIAFAGDSITEGVGSSNSLTKSYPANLEALAKANGYDVVVANYGISAAGLLETTSVYYPDRIAYSLLTEETDADYIVVGLGTNDHLASSRGGLRAAYIQNYRSFVETLGSLPDTEKVFMTSAIISGTKDIPAASQLRIRSVIAPLQRQIAGEFANTDADKYIFVDMFGLTLSCAKEGDLLGGDRVHPKDTGYVAMGEAIYGAIFDGVTESDYHRTDIYLSENGTEFGSGSKEDPTSRIDIAFAMIPEGESATVHIIGNIKYDAPIVTPLGVAKLTLVGEGEGASLEMLEEGDTVWVNSDIKVDNLTLKGASASIIMGNYHDVEFTDSSVLAGTWSFFAGICSYNTVDAVIPYDTVETTSSAKDCTVVFNGVGSFKNFALGNYRVAKAAPIGTYSGNITATVGDGYSISGGSIVGAVGQNYFTGNAKVDLPYGFSCADYASIGSLDSSVVYDSANNTGTVTVTNREAAENIDVVFVSGNGSGDGRSASTPTSDIGAAYALLGENGGTVVFVGEYSTSATVDFPTHTATVKLTSVYGGMDYRESGAALRYKGTGFVKFNGPTEIDGLVAKLDKSSAGFCANLHPLTIGYDFAVVNTDGTTSYRMYLVGGQNAENKDGALAENAVNEIKVYSGKYIMLSAFCRNTALEHKGTVTVTLGGTADVRDLYLGAIGSKSKGGSCIANITENAKVTTAFVAGSSAGMTGSTTIYVSDNSSIGAFSESDKSYFENGTRTLNIQSYTTVTLPSDFKNHFDTVNISLDTVKIENPSGNVNADSIVSFMADGKEVYYIANDTDGGIELSYPTELGSFTMTLTFKKDVYAIAEYAVVENEDGITASLIKQFENDGTVAYFGGNGNGLFPNSAAATLAECYAILGDDGGTIVISGEASVIRTYVPAHSGIVTYTSVYGGVDYRETGAKLIFPDSTASIYLGGETVFKDMNIEMVSAGLIAAQFHPVTFDTGVYVDVDYSTESNGIYLIGGDNLGSLDENAVYDKDTHITLRSGSFSRVIGSSRYSGARNHTGTAYITVENDTYICYLSTGATGSGGTANKAVVTLKDDLTLENLVIGGGESNNYMYGEVIIHVDELNGGVIQEIDVMGLYNNKGGVTLNYAKSTVPDGLLYLAGLAKFDKIQTTCIRDGAHVFGEETTSPFAEDIRIRICSACDYVDILSELPDTSYEGVVFVADGGFSDGSHPALPIGSYEDAMNALGENGGTVVLVGETTVNSNFTYEIGSDPAFFQEPVHTGKITVTCVYDGVDYREKGAKFVFGGDIHYKLSGPTTFDNIVFDAPEGTAENIVAARYNPLVFGKDVVMLKNVDDGYKFGVVGGYQYFRYTDYVGVYIEDEYLRMAQQAVPVETFELPDSKVINITVDSEIGPVYLREKAAEAFDKMFEDMEAVGLELPSITSGMQSYEFKYDYITRFWARTMRAHPDWSWDRVYSYVTKSTGRPGYSEHHLGLAVDMYDLTPDFETSSPNHDYDKTKEWAWIIENGKNYGIVLGVPETSVASLAAGCISENWHFRYVGVEHANAIMDMKYNLLEFYVGDYIGLYDKDADVTILGGDFAYVVGGSKDAANEDVVFTGTNYVTVAEDANIGMITDATLRDREEGVSGDVNNDGVINLLDAVRIFKHLADESVTVSSLADVDEDGYITFADAMLVLKKGLNK